MIENSRERAARIGIHVVVGLAAGYVSLRHVYEWSMNNAAAGADWTLGATNALVSELVPVYCLLWIRQRRRLGRSTWPGWVVLVAAAAFSITAQVAVAKPSLSGWVVSAAGTLGFWILTKMGLALASAPPTAEKPLTPGRVAVLDKAPADVEQSAIESPQSSQPAAWDNPQRKVRVKQAKPRSLTNADKVVKALDALPELPTAEQVASKAGVSVNTVRRYAPAERLAPPARRRGAAKPSEAAPDEEATAELMLV
jgi:hypothetical protein